MGDFKLSASLSGHEDDVRAVAFPSRNSVVSASRDATVRAWNIISSPPPKYDGVILSHGTAFVNAVTYLMPSAKYPEGLIVSGGKDTIIEVRHPKKTPEESAEALLLGHSSNVCALDVDASGNYIVSGGWDGKARTWLVGKWECEVVFDGHEGSVWAVLAFDHETIITGCADKLIRVFHISGKLLRTIRGSTDVVRALCRIPEGHYSGADFASAGNDGIIRLWTISGRQASELQGHESFIYSLSSLPTGEIISSGEDRTIRVWNGNELIQTITLPAISVWAVAACAENGDIVAGTSDRMVRVFSRSSERYADAETIRLFEESIKSSSIPQQQVGDLNKEKLPGPDFLQKKAGTKEGQVQMIKEYDGSIAAHQWSSSQHEWIRIGTVVDAVGSSGKKIDYLGKEYDYVFDVDIEDGKPPLKLPYNLSQNPYEAATKFIQDNKLPITYLDTVANFITDNTKGATLGPSQDQGSAGYDPWGTESRYRPGGETSTVPNIPSAPKILPQKTYLSILVSRPDNMQKKIEQLNHGLIKGGQKDISLNPTELSVLQSVRRHLDASNAAQTSQTVKGGLDLAVKLLTAWPYVDRLPGLDLLRLLAVSPMTATYEHPRGGNIIDVLESSIHEKQPPAENHVMMAIRAFTNLFESTEGRRLALREIGKVQEIVASSIADTTQNRNLLVAITTLYINYAVLFSSTEEQVADSSTSDYAVPMLDLLSKILQTQNDSEVIYRGLVATGTLVQGLDDEVRTVAKEVYDIPGAVRSAASKAVDSRIKNVASEIDALLSAHVDVL